MVLISPEGISLERSIRLEFSASDNEVEYGVLLSGLRMAKQVGSYQDKNFCDSQLVTNQVNREFKA